LDLLGRGGELDRSDGAIEMAHIAAPEPGRGEAERRVARRARGQQQARGLEPPAATTCARASIEKRLGRKVAH